MIGQSVHRRINVRAYYHLMSTGRMIARSRACIVSNVKTSQSQMLLSSVYRSRGTGNVQLIVSIPHRRMPFSNPSLSSDHDCIRVYGHVPSTIRIVAKLHVAEDGELRKPA